MTNSLPPDVESMPPAESKSPLVSVCIPLYRSKKFLEHIIANIETVKYPNLEFVVSDRHGLDDAATILRQRFENDNRVRVIEARDELSWSENCNALVREAQGKYFRWLPHDDTLPANGIDSQVAMLEDNPGAVSVSCPIHRVDLEGKPLSLIGVEKIRPIPSSAPWKQSHAIDIFANRRYGGAFKALWRRSAIVENNLFIRPVRDLVQPERVWLFAMALQGRFLFDPNYGYIKRMYPTSVSAQWNYTLLHDIDYLRCGFSYLRDATGLLNALMCMPRMALQSLLMRPLRRNVKRWR